MISYRIEVEDVHAHLFRIGLRVPRPAGAQRLSLPVWIPGSYMVREFARHLSGLRARQGEREIRLQQVDKTTWLADCDGSAALEVEYLAYAFDTSVRAAFLDANRGFFNGTSVFLRVEGREQEPHRVEIRKLPRGWQVATALPSQTVNGSGAGSYEAPDYDELIDHPVEMGEFWRGQFEARGVQHEFVVAGAPQGFDGERLLADAKAICERQIDFWHGDDARNGRRKPRAPFERYVFLLNAVHDGYGGLEHRASTALIAARRDLPLQGRRELTDGYVTLLGLISHEYFHTWNVKRLKPSEFASFDYTRENHSELLWFFEGFTSYYDDLMLLRAGRIDPARYLKLLAKNINGVLSAPGRFVQSVAQASFDAWTKYYRPDENTPNSTVSYYTKGALVALAFDLSLRAGGRGDLDEVMRQLWQASGGGPITEADIAQALREVGGRDFGAELADWVHDTLDLPLRDLLEGAGVSWSTEAPTPAQRLGVRVSETPLTGVQFKQVLRGSPAEGAGLSAGDELIAANGWRVRRLEEAFAGLPLDGALELLVARDQRMLTLSVAGLGEAANGNVALGLAPATATPASKTALALRRAWLGG